MKELLRRMIRKYGKKQLAVIVSVFVLVTTTVGFTAAYLIGQTDTLKNKFISGVDPYGSLTISKAVEHPYGDSYIIPQSVSFSYKVDLGNECAGKTYSGYTADSNGVIELNIPYGKGTTAITLNEIPKGVHAVVTEHDISAGFTPKDGAKREADIEQAKDSKADYVNVYKPSKADNKVKLGGTKTIEGRGWKDDDKFVFILEKYVDEEWVKVSEAYATKADKTFDLTSDFQAIDFTKLGTYKFRVREEEGSAGGIIYDTNVSLFDVVVTDEDMDGSLEIKGIISSSENTTISTDPATKAPVVSIAFNNKYAPAGSAEVFFNISKTMKDTSGQGKTPAGFRFGLYDGDELIAESEETTASGKVSIKQVFTPEDIGTYRRTLKEIKGSDKGMVYDDTEYDVEINVVDNGDGTISAYVYDYKPDQGDIPPGADNTYEAGFTNKYDPDDAKVNIPGVKKLSGRSLKTGEFSFDLYETDSTFDTKGKKPVKTVDNADTDGNFAFDLIFDKVGTSYFVIRENTSKPLGGVTYDTSEYRATVIVTDDGGILKAECNVTDAAGHKADVRFRNSYVPASAKYSLRGTKTLTGKALEDSMFRFALYKSDSSFSKETAAGEAVNSKDGSFSFSEFTFDKEGKHYFIVKELSDNPVKGVTYDKTVYHVTVTVKDGEEGYLVTSEDITAINGSEESSASSVSFSNSYKDPDPGSGTDPDDKSSKSKSAKTGDKSVLIAWIILMLLSGEGLMLVMIASKRRGSNKAR